MAWENLTTREKNLDRAIEASGIQLSNTKSCLDKVMRKIGAKPDEAQFVLSRIQLRIRTQQMLEETDDLISRTEAMLEAFAKDDREQERIGRRLGFNFWNKK